MSGPSPDAWRLGLHELHCREDRCGPNGERCDCPCHRGEIMPELPPAPPDPLNDALEHILAVLIAITDRVNHLDENALRSIDDLRGLVAGLANGQRVLSDRVTMLERESKARGDRP